MGLRRPGTTHHVGSCDLRFIGTHISLAVILTKDDFAGLLLTCSHTKPEQEVSKYKAWSMTRCKPGATKSNTRLGRVKQSFAHASCQAGSACPQDKISRPWHTVRQLGPAGETFTRYIGEEQWRIEGFSWTERLKNLVPRTKTEYLWSGCWGTGDMFGCVADSKRLHVFCSRVAVHPVSLLAKFKFGGRRTPAEDVTSLTQVFQPHSKSFSFFSLPCTVSMRQCMSRPTSMPVLFNTNERTTTPTIEIPNKLKRVSHSSKMLSSDL
jgi:hypothetical protein